MLSPAEKARRPSVQESETCHLFRRKLFGERLVSLGLWLGAKDVLLHGHLQLWILKWLKLTLFVFVKGTNAFDTTDECHLLPNNKVAIAKSSEHAVAVSKDNPCISLFTDGGVHRSGQEVLVVVLNLFEESNTTVYRQLLSVGILDGFSHGLN